jgi:hypothetical protein
MDSTRKATRRTAAKARSGVRRRHHSRAFYPCRRLQRRQRPCIDRTLYLYGTHIPAPRVLGYQGVEDGRPALARRGDRRKDAGQDRIARQAPRGAPC